MRATSAVARRALADSRIRTIAFACLFAALAYANVAGYRSSYPTLRDRLGFAHSFGGNKAVRLFYGEPHDLLTVGGYAAWRIAGVLTIFAGAWGLLAAIRAMRTEEESGRSELVLAGVVSRGGSFVAALAAIAAGAVLLWLATLGGLVAGGLPAGGSAYLALAVVAPAPVFVGVGALASQLAPTRRLALALSIGVLGAALLLRIVADTTSGLGGLRWATPLGWAEELRPFTGARPAVLLLFAAASAVLLGAAGFILVRRDIGSGVLPARDSAAPNRTLLSSTTAQALRSQRGTLAAWLLGTAFFALIIGTISTSASSADLSASAQQQLRKIGAVTITTPSGYIGFTFLFFVFAVSLFVCAQVGAARREEAEERLETLLALPVSRRSWLAGRLLLAACAAAAISLCAGALAWAGAASQGASVSLLRLLEAGVNCLPAALLFLGLAALAFALVPRASSGIAYGLVVAAFVWQLFGGLLGAPRWLLDVSPFQHVGLVPAQAFKAGAAAIMLALAVVAAFAAVRIFQQRDLTGA